MRILFINQYYAPDFAATAQQMADLCERLTAEGHDVHVLCGNSLYDGRKMKLAPEENINGVTVHRVGSSNDRRERLRDRLMAYIAFYIRAFVKAHTVPRPDMVVTLTTPPMIALLGAWLRLVRRSRFAYWVMDVYPDIAIRAGVLRRMGPVAGLWSLLAMISYRLANRVVVLGEDMAEELVKKGVPAHKIQVIASWADGNEVFPVAAEDNAFRREHVPEGALSVMYSGNMGTCHLFREVIAGAKALKDDPGFHFLFIGGGKQQPHLREALGGQQNVTFLPYQERNALSESLSAGDVHLISLQERYDGLLVPSKVYGIMACGRPIVFIGSERNHVARIIRESRCGVIVAPGDMQGFEAALRELRDEPGLAEEMGRRGREAFLRRYERRIGTRRFGEMLEGMVLRPGWRGDRSLAHGRLAFGESTKEVPAE